MNSDGSTVIMGTDDTSPGGNGAVYVFCDTIGDTSRQQNIYNGVTSGSGGIGSQPVVIPYCGRWGHDTGNTTGSAYRACANERECARA